VYVLAGEPTGDCALDGIAPPVIERQRPGDVIGEMTLLTGEPNAATLVARLTTDVLELRRETFLSLAARFPVLMANLARSLSRRLSAQTTAAKRERRTDAVGVVAGRFVLAHLGEVLAAVRVASAHTIDTIDLTGPKQNAQATSDALARLDTSLRTGSDVVTLLAPDHRSLSLLLDHMDRVVAVMGPDEARGLLSRLDSLAGRVEIVELGDEGARLPGQAGVIRRWSAEPQTPELAWLGRHLAGTKLGLALGAGGAKGYAHAAVVRALQRAGYTIDYIAGSSIGGWVGAWLALGMDADEIERTLRVEFTPEVVESVFRRGSAGEPSGLEVMARLARTTTAEVSIDSLGTPLVVMATDLASWRPMPIATGPLHEALIATMAVPGLYQPIDQGSQRLVDAVVTTPVPTEALSAAGADVTVAVNLLGREILPAWPGDAPPDPRVRPTARDTVVEALEVAQIDAAARQAALADVPITPRFGPGTWRHFQLADRYLAAGAEAAEAALLRLATLARPQRVASESL
jgi:NTE family protein